ncbi:MFS transporter [Mumia zhuanghuii]|uniref:MFS transporter n=1 Tax=Mumia zhuanghuii TaxID=2585211 RepID=A0A5C4MLG8_9ACTN|nr:MFS transporter [Mumia zhuanghuii]TNC33215.1 MFS transporter [Mumia zhuanghuii]TNC45353.1 MFS transporter [Mumia zhuanghuii]
MTDQPTDHRPPEQEAAPVAAPAQGTVPLTAFVGRPPMDVDLARPVPFGWWAAVVIALVAFIDRIEVNLIAGALPAIQEEFGFSDTWAGAIPTAASLAAVVLLLPAGRLADKGRRTWIVALVVLTWAMFSVASGLATTFAMFFVIRILLGAAGQLYNPPASSLLADYYPGSTRGKAFGLERAGYYMGLPVGVALGGWVAEALDWRAVFFIVAIPGVLVAALVLTVREPVRGIGDKIDRLRGTGGVESPTDELATATPTSMFAEARAVLQIASLRGITLSLALLYLGLGGLFYWLPTLLERTEDMAYDTAAGVAGGVGGVGIVIGIILGSRIGDRGHGVKPGWRIRVSLWFLLVGAISITGVVVLPGVALRIGLVALACVGFAGAIPNLTAASADVVPAARRGLGFAAVQFLLSLGGALGPFLIGVVSDATGSINIAFLALVPPLFASVLILRWAAHTYDEDARKALAGT